MACFNCGIDEPRDEEFETVCSDCCVVMCDTCKNDDDILCGCYGRCDSCNRKVNRGSDGRKCRDCQEWLCYKCKMESECSSCGIGVDSSEIDDDEDNEEDTDDYTDDFVINYLKSDEWGKYTDYIQELYENKKEIIQEMKDKMQKLHEENKKIKEQISELEEKMIINNYLSEYIFNSNILIEGNDDEIFQNMIKYRKKYLNIDTIETQPN